MTTATTAAMTIAPAIDATPRQGLVFNVLDLKNKNALKNTKFSSVKSYKQFLFRVCVLVLI